MADTKKDSGDSNTIEDHSNKEMHLKHRSKGGKTERPGRTFSDTMISTKSSHKKAISTHRMKSENTTSVSSEGEEEDFDIDDEDSEGLSSENGDKKLAGKGKIRKLNKAHGSDNDLAPRDTNINSKIHVDIDDDLSRRETKAYYLSLTILTALSIATRLYNIEIPAHVCWDETHFGKMGSWYINRTFFFDVHPPLGKMLIGLAGVLTGYNGSFPFSKPGDEYGDANYVGMRVFCAILGSLLVPMSYEIVWLLTHSILAAIFAGCLILFETGTLILSRHILLDPILMFFIILSVLTCLRFLCYRNRPFSLPWWGWMAATGVALACAIGVKFVGLFVILLVGYTTASDLWNYLCDLSVPLSLLLKHIIARVLGLIIIPVLVYCLIFHIHFKVLSKSGNGDGFFSTAFQSQLAGNKLYNVSMPQYVAYGSIITLKQRRTGGAYLHSHVHLYPEEHPPKQQQVTTYSHKDENNKWLVKPTDREMGPDEKAIYVMSGDLIRLEHVSTRRNLHSHKEPAPLTKHQYQVSGYGMNGTGDANDFWLVEVEGAERGDRVQTVRSKIRLIHYHVQCALYSHDKKLPKWGWEQLEATCHPNRKEPNAAWNVEEVIDPRLPNVSFDVYSPTFVEKFLESHAVMTQGNSGLKPKEGEVTSRPWQWPIDYRGQVFSGQNHRIYMLGNPIIFWFLLFLKVVFILLWTAFKVGKKRNLIVDENLKTYCERTFKVCWWLLLAWFLHFAPFWGMSRVLYFHHYFPAFLFSAMFGGVMIDLVISFICVCVPEDWASKVFKLCFFLILGGIVHSFYLFHPLAYGMSGPMASEEGAMMHKLKWMDSWDL